MFKLVPPCFVSIGDQDHLPAPYTIVGPHLDIDEIFKIRTCFRRDTSGAEGKPYHLFVLFTIKLHSITWLLPAAHRQVCNSLSLLFSQDPVTWGVHPTTVHPLVAQRDGDHKMTVNRLG